MIALKRFLKLSYWGLVVWGLCLVIVLVQDALNRFDRSAGWRSDLEQVSALNMMTNKPHFVLFWDDVALVLACALGPTLIAIILNYIFAGSFRLPRFLYGKVE